MARGNTISKTAVWILLALLILGLGGFGVTNLSGGVSPVGYVGDEEIGMDDYARELQQEIRAVEADRGSSLPFPEAQNMGLDSQVLGRLITAAALDHEAAQLGLSIGDENLARQITEIPAFQGPGGDFDREAYTFALDRVGLGETQFEEQLRKETARTLMQGALVRGVQMPDTFTDTLMTYAAERRNFSYIRLDQADLDAPLGTPGEDELRSYYEANLSRFTTPEMKRITYAWLSPEMVVEQIDLPEDVLRTEYERRADDYNRPERRLVERLGFADAAAAEQAKSRIAAGETTFDAVVQDRGLELADVDMGDVARGDIGAAADAVFGAEVGEVVGPVDSPVGPALYRVNAKLDAQETPFEEVEQELRDEIALDRARRLIETRLTEIDSLLAGGATLEELESEAGMQVAQIDWFPESGEGPANYESFREAAQQVAQDDFPEVAEMEDGGVFALRLDEVIDPQVQPFEDVRASVLAGWQTAETNRRLRELAEGLLPRISEGRAMTSLGYDVREEREITRGGFIAGTPPDFLEQVFAMTPGTPGIIDGMGAVYVVQLDAVLPPDTEIAEVARLRSQLAEQARQGLAQDLFQAFASDIQARAGLQLDQTAINAVHANFQ
ncbi:peptidyl-prolyl cis-trans isomerase [Lutimaribacter sp. EGI FJ00015]|uniref:Peptidyl-prolyl cis-trans isomerase n=1 Tax=Lutimaribacter degradans TaxID=2945989 RepID=A0ACC5ZT53_9RHOB|nr:peptidyl-prolyl cis-trans isomerase [Lutimaribacter sp. EGI FJ00013]MCM2561123.1 peptidyl-prolyl cis-trans isomerase [Lutimaribacter sp. EGI FJ00013]MCO0611928.1 peptidyl-prolyl cis-trans isomerase [Lutimaribacter sp. EGI FJ00015]MCO0634951.1 peptidyl-prolyl cis-trans isomerase [Lutimaribacter sp. EGI FJ00014]